jgi:hypothetical protein
MHAWLAHPIRDEIQRALGKNEKCQFYEFTAIFTQRCPDSRFMRWPQTPVENISLRSVYDTTKRTCDGDMLTAAGAAVGGALFEPSMVCLYITSENDVKYVALLRSTD